jgi:HD-GYP domain-containing protein (c-di-GMP phosphodiesterase class II)
MGFAEPRPDAGGDWRELMGLIDGLSQLELVAPGSLDVEPRMMTLLDECLSATGGAMGGACLVQAGALRTAATRQAATPGELSEWGPWQVTHAVVGTGEVMCTADVAALGEGLNAPEPMTHHAAAAQGPVSFIAVPIRDEEGAVIGVLELLDARDASGGSVPFENSLRGLVQSYADRMGAAVANARLASRLRRAQFETVFRLSVAAEFRDSETAAHIQRMSLYAGLIAEGLGMPRDQVELARFASPMHDVGKLGVPDAVLLKPGKLDAQEWHIMRSHTTMGAQILSGSDSPLLRASERIALTHHERMDGSGYPLGIRGEEIPTMGRIVGLADAFDAITSPRCYKPAKPMETGLEIVLRDSGTHFDPQCVEVLERRFDDFLEVRSQFAADDSDPVPEWMRLT